MDIGEAVKHMWEGGKVSRSGWNGKNMYLFMNFGGDTIRSGTLKVGIMLPFVNMKTATGEVVPWLCSQSDLLAKDWGTVVLEPAQYE
jgi:hypothetical protein